MIEVEVHQQLRAFLREQGEPYWPHHLTMARLVARALRLGRSALIQAGPPSGDRGRYRLSYLASALIWSEPVVLVASESLQQRLLMVEIPRLQQWIQTPKAIQIGDCWPYAGFQGLLMVTPDIWLADRLGEQKRFPEGIPVILDGVDDLETWTRDRMTASLHPGDWDALMLACPAHSAAILDVRAHLMQSIFQHPASPYECCLLEASEQDSLHYLYQELNSSSIETELSSPDPIAKANATVPHVEEYKTLPTSWQKFWRYFQAEGQLLWARIARRQGQFSLHCAPIDISIPLQSVWTQQPVVLIGGALDLESTAPTYRQRIGLEDLTCVKFPPDRQSELIQLYLPDGLPMPNTPQFQAALVQQIRELLSASLGVQGLTAILVSDMPLQAQLASILASEFGSRVQVEKTCLDDNGILVTGWEFWQQHQGVLPAPHLLAIATLPIPSLENPLVAGRVNHYKRLHQDWFRLYLLPEALTRLQRAIAPIRECQGTVALFDNRVIHRSYGKQVLAALSPLARSNYFDPSLLVENNPQP